MSLPEVATRAAVPSAFNHLSSETLLRLQSEVGNKAVGALLGAGGVDPAKQECCSSCSAGNTCEEEESGAGHDLTSPRFAGDQRLEACYDDETRLTQGATGESVAKVQGALAELGYDLGPAGVDGKYGPRTWEAVKTFKRNESLDWEHMGDVGPETMRRLNDLFPRDSKPDRGKDHRGNDADLGACHRLMFDDELIVAGGPAIQPQIAATGIPFGCDIQIWLRQFLQAVAHPLDGLTTLQRARLLQAFSQKRGNIDFVLGELSTLPTSDLVDALRVDRLFTTPSLPQGLPQHATFLPIFEAVVNSNASAATPRVAAAIRTARSGTVSPQDRRHLSSDDAATLDALAAVRNWPTLLQTVQPGTMTAAQQMIVDFIHRARDNVPDRSKDFTAVGGGFLYMGKSPKDPTQIAGTSNRARFNDIVWKEIASEGGNSAINTSDVPRTRWGRGFLGVQLVQMVARFISNSPAAMHALLDVGITIGPRVKGGQPRTNDWLIVDEQSGAIREGTDALNLIKGDLRILSLLAELSEDDQTAQQFADAQFEQLRVQGGTGAAAASDAVVNTVMSSWPAEFIRFAAHAMQHGGGASSAKYAAISPPTSTALVRRWGMDWGSIQTNAAVPKSVTVKPPHLGAFFCQPVTVQEMLAYARANGLAGALGSSAPLPPEYTGGAVPTGPAQFAGHIFYGDVTGPKFPGTRDPVNWFHLPP